MIRRGQEVHKGYTLAQTPGVAGLKVVDRLCDTGESSSSSFDNDACNVRDGIGSWCIGDLAILQTRALGLMKLQKREMYYIERFSKLVISYLASHSFRHLITLEEGGGGDRRCLGKESTTLATFLLI